MTPATPPLTPHGEPRCPYVAASKWGPARCVLPEGHTGRHAYGASEGGGMSVRGPTERYVRDYALQRQRRTEGWDEMEQALVMTLIDWRCESDLRPSSGEGSDCSDLMNTALARLLGLARGDLTPQQVLDAIEPPREGGA